MGLNIINRINYGYHSIEPVILGLMAMNKIFMLIGRHGTGKTRMARLLSSGYGKTGFVFYDATKDDLISIAGIPNPDAIKNGQLTFTPHQRSIWNKDTIVVDEITRAGKENQNIWLEILEDRTCFGMPLSYRTVIATANPESYASAFRMDNALLDRFHAVIPVPELQSGTGVKDLKNILQLSFSAGGGIEPEEIARTFSEIQYAHQTLEKEGAAGKVVEYCAQVGKGMLDSQDETKTSEGVYISPRTYGKLLPETIMAVAAYYSVEGSEEPLAKGALEALTYSISQKLNISMAQLEPLHYASEYLLKAGEISEGMKLKMELLSLDTFEERIKYLQNHTDRLKKHLLQDELEKFLGELLRGASKEGEKEKLVMLQQRLKELGYGGDIYRQVDGQLILTLNAAVSYIIPILNSLNAKPAGKHAKAWNNIEVFKQMVSAGTFISSNSEDVQRVKTFIIDVYEEDEEANEENLLNFFDSVDLTAKDNTE